MSKTATDYNYMQVVKQLTPKRSGFNLSHQVLQTTDFGLLTPFLCMECLPSDTFNMSVEMYIKATPLIAPVMDKMDVFIHYFFVPNRLVWNDWEDFITGGEDGTSTPLFPRFVQTTGINDTYFGPNSLADYLGIPQHSIQENNQGDIESVSQYDSIEFSAIPFRDYQLIYDEYYRNQNTTPSVFDKDDLVFTGSGLWHSLADFDKVSKLRYVTYANDYFTSALPWTQRGEEVTIPIGTSAPVTIDTSSKNSQLFRYQNYTNGNISTPLYSEDLGSGAAVFGHNTAGLDGKSLATPQLGNLATPGTDGYEMYFENQAVLDLNGTHQADLSSVTGFTINEFRESLAIQRMLENDARFGSRYVEQLQGVFGVEPDDARMQRPEYIGGTKATVQIQEVIQVSESNQTAQGSQTGLAYAIVPANVACKKYCKEHGYIMGLMSIVPKTSYRQGLAKHWTKFDRFDYFRPEFAHLGEQELWKSEIYYEGKDSRKDEIFGYVPRYAEYRTMYNRQCGEFNTSLAYWTLNRQFNSNVALNTDFMEVRPENMEHIFATDASLGNHFYVQIWNNINAVRPLPKFGTPTL